MMDFLRGFFIGRYGFDMLGKYLLWTSIIFTVLGTFKALWFLKPLSTVLLIVCIVRMLSKNMAFACHQAQYHAYTKMTFEDNHYQRTSEQMLEVHEYMYLL